MVELKDVSGFVPTFSQCITGNEPGAYTGSITAEMVRNTGAKGVIINHSERKITIEEIKKCLKFLEGIKNKSKN